MVASSTTSNMVKLGSHLDVRNVGLARAALYEVIENASGDVVVDMANLESIDAAGLGMLTAVAPALRAQPASTGPAQLSPRDPPGARRHPAQPHPARRPGARPPFRLTTRRTAAG